MSESSLYAWGGPAARGRMRSRPEDFQVFEDLGYGPDGEGEHVWLEVEKRERNTQDVAVDLARLAGVSIRQVSFAGLKDRRAVTRQTFSVHLPGKPDPVWPEQGMAGVRLVSMQRASRKLRRGGLAGNRFVIVVRELHGDRPALVKLLERVAHAGVPNGFGRQRFGGNNLARARALFSGCLRRRPGKHKRGLYLSAARSLIFNRVLIERIRRGDWNRLIDGDLAMLDSSRSWFVADAADAEQTARCQRLDVHPTGPLVGADDPPVRGLAADIERAVLAEHHELVDGLARFRLQAQRRALRARVKDLQWDFLAHDVVELRFALNAGGYATSVLRELIQVDE